MYNAPSVMFPVGRCGFYAGALSLLALLAALVLGMWWGTAAEARSTWWGWAGAACWLAWVGFAAWSWQRSPTGQLAWNGLGRADPTARAGMWLWHSASCPEGAPLRRVETVLDLQDRALLRLHNADALARWVWVERARDPARWNDLRRALVAARA